MPDILLYLLPHIAAALLYAGLGYHFWRTRWNEAGGPVIPLPVQAWEKSAIALALLLQGIGLYRDILSGGGLRFSFGLAASLMLWLAVFIHWLENFRSRLAGMQPVVLSLASVSAALPALFSRTHEIAYAEDMGFRMHFLVAMLTYGLFALSALHAGFAWFVEYRLHRGSLNARRAGLPSILSMESLLFRMIGIAFPLLTLTLISGLVFSGQRAEGKNLFFDHKFLFAFLSWGIFAALLFGRFHYGWRGRVALRWTLAGFFLLLLAYIGSRFVLEVVLGLE
jgi:ABC-type uncharacterized transport system permease subunit